MQYPSYVFAETLRDGTAVTVRAAGANDGPKIRRAFLNLERDTVYTRFFGYKADVSDAELGRITGADFERAVALLVTIGAGEDEVVIGGASYFVSAGRSAARRRCCCGRNLRSTQVRRAFRDAVDHSQAKMPQFDLRKAEVRCLQGDLSADPGDLRRIHADHRAIVTRRGVSRRGTPCNAGTG